MAREPVPHIEFHPHHSTTLRQDADLLRNGRPAARLDLELRYCPLDPFAVGMSLRTDGASVEWALARETLLEGVLRHEGLADVAAWPVRRPDGEMLLRIRLGPPRGCAVIQTERNIVAAWLGLTTRLVPVGRETAHIDWDAFLASALNDH